MTSESEMSQELLSLRDLTRRTGILHEAQVVNLKYWPYVLFNISDHQILPDDLRRVLTFNVKFSKKKPKNIKDLCRTLEQWCWALLGKEYMVRVRDARSGLYLYHGSRGVDWTPPRVEGVEQDLTFEQMEEEDADGADGDDGGRGKRRRGAGA